MSWEPGMKHCNNCGGPMSRLRPEERNAEICKHCQAEAPLLKCSTCGDVTARTTNGLLLHEHCKAPVLGVYRPYFPVVKP